MPVKLIIGNKTFEVWYRKSEYVVAGEDFGSNLEMALQKAMELTNLSYIESRELLNELPPKMGARQTWWRTPESYRYSLTIVYAATVSEKAYDRSDFMLQLSLVGMQEAVLFALQKAAKAENTS